jgi:hypothetical protein
LLLVFVSYRLTREIAGPDAWVVIPILCVEPNLLAHSTVVTTDIPYAVTVLLTVWTVFRLLEVFSVKNVFLLGLAFGLCLTAKFTSVLLVLAFLLIPVFSRWGSRKQVLQFYAIGLPSALLISALVVSCLYGFFRFATPLHSIPFHSDLFKTFSDLFPWLRLPLPAPFLTGIDLCLQRERALGWNVILLGQNFPDGIWYYFPLLWLWKTPLAILAGLVAVFAGCVATRRLGLANPKPRMLFAVLLFSLVYFSVCGCGSQLARNRALCGQSVGVHQFPHPSQEERLSVSGRLQHRLGTE